MSSPYEICAFFPEGFDREQAVYGTHALGVQWGARVSEESLLLLSRTPSQPDVCRDVPDVNTALAQMASWPASAGLEYVMHEMMVTVQFLVFPGTPGVAVIGMAIPEHGFESAGRAVHESFAELARRLHERFPARRTVMGWGLERVGDWDVRELERLKRGEFGATYELVDLRRER